VVLKRQKPLQTILNKGEVISPEGYSPSKTPLVTLYFKREGEGMVVKG